MSERENDFIKAAKQRMAAEKAYERSCDNWNRDAEFDRLLKLLPKRVWLE